MPENKSFNVNREKDMYSDSTKPNLLHCSPLTPGWITYTMLLVQNRALKP